MRLRKMKVKLPRTFPPISSCPRIPTGEETVPCLSQGHRTLPQEEGVCPESPAPNLLTTSISDKRELLPWPTFPPHSGSQIKVFKQAQEFTNSSTLKKGFKHGSTHWGWWEVRAFIHLFIHSFIFKHSEISSWVLGLRT